MAQRGQRAILTAFVCLIVLGVVGLLARGSDAVRVRDAAALDAFSSLRAHGLEPWLTRIIHLGDPGPVLLIAALLFALALRQSAAHATGVGVLLVGAPLSAMALKQVLAFPRPAGPVTGVQIDPSSWPSGHATAAMTLALALTLVVPPSARILAALGGGAVALAVGYATIGLAWHLPTDVLGAFALAAAWGCLAVAVIKQWPTNSERSSPRLTVIATALVGAATIAGVAFLVGYDARHPAMPAAATHRSLFIAAVALAAAAALAEAVVVFLARPSR